MQMEICARIWIFVGKFAGNVKQVLPMFLHFNVFEALQEKIKFLIEKVDLTIEISSNLLMTWFGTV